MATLLRWGLGKCIHCVTVFHKKSLKKKLKKFNIRKSSEKKLNYIYVAVRCVLSCYYKSQKVKNVKFIITCGKGDQSLTKVF